MREKKYFSRYREHLAPLPYLAEIQLESYKWFLEEGLKELFKEFSPIRDYGGGGFYLGVAGFVIDETEFD